MKNFRFGRRCWTRIGSVEKKKRCFHSFFLSPEFGGFVPSFFYRVFRSFFFLGDSLPLVSGTRTESGERGFPRDFSVATVAVAAAAAVVVVVAVVVVEVERPRPTWRGFRPSGGAESRPAPNRPPDLIDLITKKKEDSDQ